MALTLTQPNSSHSYEWVSPASGRKFSAVLHEHSTVGEAWFVSVVGGQNTYGDFWSEHNSYPGHIAIETIAREIEDAEEDRVEEARNAA